MPAKASPQAVIAAAPTDWKPETEVAIIMLHE